jgi:hypothetical protein
MAEIEQLSILIDVIDSFDEELNRLLFKLGQVDTAVEAVDPVRIDVEVNGQHELESLLLDLAALQAADSAGVGNVDVGVNRTGGGAAAATSAAGGVGSLGRLEESVMAIGEMLSETLADFDADVGDTTKTVRHLSDSAGEAADGLLEMDLRMSDIHNALARLVPLLLVFVGAIPAVIGGLIALAAAAAAAAAALAGITALGAIGFGLAEGDGDITEGLSEALEQIQDDFLDAFRPMAERLAHVFEGALDGLGRLFQRIANRGDALMGFVDEAQDVGSFLVETIPPFLQDVAQFADAADEALGVVINRIGNVDIFAALANVLADVLPPLLALGDALLDLAPVLFNISVGFLRVTNQVLNFFGLIGDLLSFLPLTQEQFGLFTAAILAAATAIFILNTALVSNLAGSLVKVGQFIISAASTMWTYSFAADSAAIATFKLSAALRTLATAALGAGLIGGLAVAVGSIAGVFNQTSNSIDSATESLRAFERQSNRMSGGANPYRNPDVGRGDVAGRFGGSNVVDVTIEGDADEQTTRQQTQNALYRLERPGRAR